MASLLGAHAKPALAAAAGDISLPEGFRAELVYEVPLDKQGSWVALTVDDKGRIIASDQHGSLYRVTPSPVGAGPEQTKVETIGMSIGMAQGLLFVDGRLYVMMNGRLGSFTSGLYRLSDSNQDDQFDRLEQLRVFRGDGEHGPHAVVLSPDKKSLYLCAGNFTALPAYDRTRVPARWAEDQLLPRIFDPMGHANEIKPPAAWVARCDFEGHSFEVISVGYRNIYDIAFNADGELFTFDSDMEWDIGTPWYRPTRICHVTSGSDWGWRSGNGPWPTYYPDTLPPVVDIGLGSPTGMTFGYDAKFPPAYKRMLFVGDWSLGNIYAVRLTPNGASYAGEFERFAWAMPLGVTDMLVHPMDGAMYFAVGGRKSESALYRIVWDGASGGGGETKSDAPAEDEAARASRGVRHGLEALHSPDAKDAVSRAWPHLADKDRFIRYAARVALEHQPVQVWSDRGLRETNPKARTTALVALARTASPDIQSLWRQSLAGITFADMPRPEQLALVRAAALAVMRFDPISPATRDGLVAYFDPHFPAGDRALDRELGALLVRLKAPGMVDRLLAQLERAATQEEGIDLSMQLSVVQEGWSIEKRAKLLDWFDGAAKMGGGLSCFGYIVSCRDRFIAGFPDADRKELAARVEQPLVAATAPLEIEQRPFVREWKLDEAASLVEGSTAPRDFETGRRMFSATGCYNCHRIAGEGSNVGPDLTGVGRRFGARDILRSIIEPNHTISDQYRQTIYDVGGKTYVGRITNINQDNVMVSTNMLDPKSTVSLVRAEIESEEVSDISMMPEGLLNTCTAEEMLDLVAFLRSGGDRQHELFRGGPRPTADSGDQASTPALRP